MCCTLALETLLWPRMIAVAQRNKLATTRGSNRDTPAVQEDFPRHPDTGILHVLHVRSPAFRIHDARHRSVSGHEPML